MRVDKWNLIIDVSACTNCNNCVVATQDEFMGNAFPGYSAAGGAQVKTMDVTRHVRGEGSMVDVAYVPRMCNHCDDAPCMKFADGAIRKRPDGIVIVDPEAAKGRRDLVDACPYGAIVWNEAEQVPQNWIFDAHLIDQGWSEPRAAQSCPTRAIEAVKLSDAAMADRAGRDGLEVLKPELRTRPRVYYRNLAGSYAHFIGGNVTATIDGRSANIAGAEVVLIHDGARAQTSVTDAFGDFRFDGIIAAGDYAVEVSAPDRTAAKIAIEGPLAESRVLAIALA
jgi:Fe-S-cluster-containing dehydrogenase component